ncbi:carboxypeptidase regulatory-like domain-containing protein, partial [Candidatus Uhrbacteria bacterium]|nr:carboxypeptidase regulatory-like domain-containing protein [Candidatus Uhrbacteria bacterium]
PFLTGVNVAANVPNQDIVTGPAKVVTVNIVDSVDAAVVLDEIFIEFFDDTTGNRQQLFMKDLSSGTVNLPDGDYDVFVHSMSVPIDPTADIAAVSGGAAISSGVVTVTADGVIKIVVADLKTVTGTLLDDALAPVEDAWIQVSDPTSGMNVGTLTDSNGDYSINVPDGSYQVNAFSPGMILDPVSLVVDGAELLDLDGTVTDQTIAGTVTDLSGNPVPYSFVQATGNGGIITSTQADADGDYVLAVDDGSWNTTANGHGYQRKSIADAVIIDGSSATSKDVQFTALDATIKDPKVTSVTPSEGGMGSDTNLGLTVTIPSNALSTSSSAGTLSMKETNNVVSTATTDVIGKGFEVSMTDNGGTALTSGFSEEVTIERTMTVAELNAEGITTAAEVDKMGIGYYGSQGTWIAESTTVVALDASGNVVAAPASNMGNVDSYRFKVAVDHFTVFAITAPSDGVAPAVPAGVASAAATTGNTISWTAVTTNSDLSSISDLAGYELYRDTVLAGSYSTQVNGSDILTTSYEDTTAVAGTLYYYKVTAADTGGLESTKSAAVSATRTTASSGGGGGGSGRGLITQPTTTVDPAPETVVTEETILQEGDSTLGIVRDSEGRRVAASTGELGASPITGAFERISAISAGQFVRSYGFNTVYYVDENLKRRPFWDSRAFLTWGTDWDDIVWVTDATLQTMPMNAPMLPQAGRVLVKIQSDARVYAIESDPYESTKDILRWIPSEEVANEIYGSSWSDYIIDLEPTVFVRYSTGTEIALDESIDTSSIQTRMQISSM